MPSSAETLICRGCHLPADVPRDEFDLFEQMHYNSFHYAFEHWADPDEECAMDICGSATRSGGHQYGAEIGLGLGGIIGGLVGGLASGGIGAVSGFFLGADVRSTCGAILGGTICGISELF